MVPAARCVPSSDHACTDPARLQAAEAMFKDMDTDGNGALDTMEFQCKCSDFGLDDASIQRLASACSKMRVRCGSDTP